MYFHLCIYCGCAEHSKYSYRFKSLCLGEDNWDSFCYYFFNTWIFLRFRGMGRYNIFQTDAFNGIAFEICSRFNRYCINFDLNQFEMFYHFVHCHNYVTHFFFFCLICVHFILLIMGWTKQFSSSYESNRQRKKILAKFV